MIGPKNGGRSDSEAARAQRAAQADDRRQNQQPKSGEPFVE